MKYRPACASRDRHGTTRLWTAAARSRSDPRQAASARRARRPGRLAIRWNLKSQAMGLARICVCTVTACGWVCRSPSRAITSTRGALGSASGRAEAATRRGASTRSRSAISSIWWVHQAQPARRSVALLKPRSTGRHGTSLATMGLPGHPRSASSSMPMAASSASYRPCRLAADARPISSGRTMAARAGGPLSRSHPRRMSSDSRWRSMGHMTFCTRWIRSAACRAAVAPIVGTRSPGPVTTSPRSH